MIKKIGKFLVAALALAILLVVAAIFWPVRSAPLPDPMADRLISNVHVVDVRTGDLGSLADVMIRDGRIVEIGPSLQPGPDMPVLDGKGGYLVPGFWDMHVHAFQLSPQMHLPLFVANGVTGVRDMMDCPETKDPLIACVEDKRRWTRSVSAGKMTSPRFVEVASFYFDNGEMSPAEAVARARTYGKRGVDRLKVYNGVSRETYFALAKEGRALGISLVGHLPKAVKFQEAIASGQLSFEHAHLLVRACARQEHDWRTGVMENAPPVEVIEKMVDSFDTRKCDTLLQRLKASNSWLVPTHVTREEDARAHESNFVNDPRLDYLDPLSRWAYGDDLASTAAQFKGRRGANALDRYFEAGLRLTGAAHSAGVPILVGTDTAIGGFRYHDEMALLHRAGMTPASILKAATADAARYAGKERDFGTVSVGKVADLVLLRANPVADIGNTRTIEAVVLGGRLYDRRRLDQLLDFTKSQAHAPANWVKLVWGFLTSPVASEL
ncbi:MAG: amidohydrolase family protein [Sphingopyxis sp.]|uniref:amidohydrolase family protein n=1 Tax=Sphingopyxis sp. TaxID=1908224 RepID=UPI002ABB9E95|nr:amidohydrolase family protein [Sphingopyxis sp.]MDZ3833322.1 amidohydrolase family protein [Sphingopyxis sp.]